MQHPFVIAALVTWPAILMCCFTKCPSTYHAGVHGGLFNVAGNTSDKCISVLKVGVKVCLETNRRPVKFYHEVW